MGYSYGFIRRICSILNQSLYKVSQNIPNVNLLMFVSLIVQNNEVLMLLLRL